MDDLPAELDTLRRVLGEFARRRRTSVYDTILALGFEVLDRPENWDYHCTPVNGVTFGATGGDGIHLNVLTSGPATGAVVLTAPPSDTPNIILGESFASFLRLGYFGCFAWLEVLAFDPTAGESQYRDAVTLTGDAVELRDALRAAFSLEPVTRVTAYLADLQDRYLAHVVLPDQVEWDARHGV